ncbi:MAG: 4Fe-4S dicluster domain-containing protein [Promethearchaeota archaeon]
MSSEFDANNVEFMGVPRKKIPWWPTIDYEKCTFCMECDKFCPHQVYKKQENDEKKLVVENPYNCVVFCRACAKACPEDGALMFPDKRETTRLIKTLRGNKEKVD